MNIKANEPSSWSRSSLVNPVVEKLVQTVSFSLVLVVSLIGNSLIAIIVFKTPTLRKPINFMIANMAMSNLLFPIFLFPLNLVELQADTLHIRDPLYQNLGKIGFFLSTISAAMSVQSLILITVDRFGAVVVPIRSPLISKKHCPFFIIASCMDRRSSRILAYLYSFKLIEHPGQMAGCTRQISPTNIYQQLAVTTAFFYISLAFVDHTLRYRPDQA